MSFTLLEKTDVEPEVRKEGSSQLIQGYFEFYANIKYNLYIGPFSVT